MTEAIISGFIAHGPIGLVALVAIAAWWRKDRELSQLYATLIARFEAGATTNEKVASKLEQLVAAVEKTYVRRLPPSEER